MGVRPSKSSVYTVRAAEDGDLSAIADTYNDAVLNSTATFDTEPATPAEFEQWLRDRSHPYAVLVAEGGGEVVGWAALKPFASKPAYRFTAENTVYVRADMRGKDVGKALLGRLLEAAAENGFRTVIARIAAPNPASVRLHRRFGFRRVGVEREVGRKFGRWLDVVVMQKALAE
ncbi:MAG: N-acetyltransferase [Chloroflexi bacterium]|nr:N-acetyltransferase [Chloroflexota bacterium]